MSCYISTNENRFYAAVELAYGYVAPVVDTNRLPAVRLAARQEMERIQRRDKMGGRTFGGIPTGIRRRSSFELTTYMMDWAAGAIEPNYGPLFLAALGGPVLVFPGGTLQAISGTELRFTNAHGLATGQGVSCGGEMRFVSGLVDATRVRVNAPFTVAPQQGWPIDRTITYLPGSDLKSVSIYDYWSPGTSVHRILAGAAIDRLRISINSDFHAFSFFGVAKDLLDSASFQEGEAGLGEFPLEPALTAMNYSVVPGNLGQAWLGSSPDQFFTLTGAEVEVANNLDMRAREFGLDGPQCVAPGPRSITANFSLYEKPDSATKELYQAARQRSPISVMFQLGIQTNQLCGVYMKSVIPEVPDFVDDETRLEWRFRDCRAVGTFDDEISVAFA